MESETTGCTCQVELIELITSAKYRSLLPDLWCLSVLNQVVKLQVLFVLSSCFQVVLCDKPVILLCSFQDIPCGTLLMYLLLNKMFLRNPCSISMPACPPYSILHFHVSRNRAGSSCRNSKLLALPLRHPIHGVSLT